ncbi:MAG TPA: AraC family transcriptional regulator [Puia sp.]|nr:AraC family transcriptional regulator [Puia sp.]
MLTRDDSLIREIREFIDAHFYQENGIADLCLRFNVNRDKLQLGFRRIVGSTVHSYIIRRRMDIAARRLRETHDAIKTIALESGYKKQRSFAKTFKSIYDLSPAVYRKRHQQ